MKSLLILPLLFLLMGCDSPEPTWTLKESKRIEPIVSVFMNKSWDYTVFIKKDKQLCFVSLQASNIVSVYTDVENDKPMYAIVKRYTAEGGNKKVEIELHIHVPANIQ